MHCVSGIMIRVTTTKLHLVFARLSQYFDLFISICISVPNAPTVTSLASTQTTITVDWTSPVLDYIDWYRIDYNGTYIDTTPRNLTVSRMSAKTATLVGLSSGELYVVTVTAVSGMETSVSAEERIRTSRLKIRSWIYCLDRKLPIHTGRQ